MNPLAEIAGIAVAMCTASLMFALVAQDATQILIASGLLFASGVLLKLSWKSS